MVDKKYMFDFLEDLSNNNSKEWMDENRARYQKAKEIWLEEVDLILTRLAKHDPYFIQFQPKQTISRINNNRRFDQSKPLYKDYFNCMPMNRDDRYAKIAIAAGVSWSFLGGGLYMPEKEPLEKMRQAVDYDGEVLKEIVQEPRFKAFFGGLSEDKNALKTAPRGYAKDHPHIDLLRRKSFTATVDLSPELVQSDHFVDHVEEAYLLLQPFNEYIEKAITF